MSRNPRPRMPKRQAYHSRHVSQHGELLRQAAEEGIHMQYAAASQNSGVKNMRARIRFHFLIYCRALFLFLCFGKNFRDINTTLYCKNLCPIPLYTPFNKEIDPGL